MTQQMCIQALSALFRFPSTLIEDAISASMYMPDTGKEELVKELTALHDTWAQLDAQRSDMYKDAIKEVSDLRDQYLTGLRKDAEIADAQAFDESSFSFDA